MSESLKRKLADKSLSPKLLFSILGIELAVFLIAILLDIIIHLPLYTFGRLLHYFVLLYATSLVWSSLPEGKLSRLWQIILFSIIPLTEFFLLNILGYSNLWGLLFLALYHGILAVILDIDLSDSSGGMEGGNFRKIIKSAIKGLTK